MHLPIFKDDNKNMMLMQSAWSTQINPMLSNPSLQGVLLKNVTLINGSNVINHKLGQTPQGWYLVDINGAAQVYRSAAFNKLTLTLTSNANVTVSMVVF